MGRDLRLQFQGHTRDGRESKVDSIICATGFELSYAPRVPILGRDGVTSNKPGGLPLSGSNRYARLLHNTQLRYPARSWQPRHIIEMLVRFICRMVQEMQMQNYRSFCLRHSVARAYQNHALSYLKRTVWAASCTSKYKNGTKDGELRLLHSDSRIQLFTVLDDPRYEDLSGRVYARMRISRFVLLANGFTELEEECPPG